MSDPMPEATYDERCASAKVEVVNMSWARLNELKAIWGGELNAGKEKFINSANAAYEAGLILQSMCGHEIMSLTYWQSKCAGNVEFDFELAKLFMAYASKMTRKAVKFNETYQFLQLSLFADGSIEAPRRMEKQVANTIAPIQQFYNNFAAFRQQLEKISIVTPMQDWDVAELSRFLYATQWLEDERERAMRLREQVKDSQ